MRIISVVGALLLISGCSSSSPNPLLETIGGTYASYGQVDDLSRWAHSSCYAPDSEPRSSTSLDSKTHGKKLYYLFAKDREAYVRLRRPQPAGQVLVKESWVPVPGSLPPVAGERGPLFLMVKTGAADSDAGWIYATLTADGRSVTAAGKLPSCMGCHQSAPHDRLFGL